MASSLLSYYVSYAYNESYSSKLLIKVNYTNATNNLQYHIRSRVSEIVLNNCYHEFTNNKYFATICHIYLKHGFKGNRVL